MCYPFTHSFGREKKARTKSTKIISRNVMLIQSLLDRGEMLSVKGQANLQIPSPPPNQQSSHPKCMTRTRLHKAATEKQRHKILPALLRYSSIYCILTLSFFWTGKAILRDRDNQNQTRSSNISHLCCPIR